MGENSHRTERCLDSTYCMRWSGDTHTHTHVGQGGSKNGRQEWPQCQQWLPACWYMAPARGSWIKHSQNRSGEGGGSRERTEVKVLWGPRRQGGPTLPEQGARDRQRWPGSRLCVAGMPWCGMLSRSVMEQPIHIGIRHTTGKGVWCHVLHTSSWRKNSPNQTTRCTSREASPS